MANRVRRDAVGRARDTQERLDLLERRLRGAGGGSSFAGTEVVDWDDAVDPGFYWGDNAANTPVAMISGQEAVGIVFAAASDSRKQVLFSAGGGAGATRYMLSGSPTWTSWIDLSPIRTAADSSELGTANLNDVVDSGWYLQSDNALATTARNYPNVGGVGGHLEVTGDGDFVMQRYTERGFGNGVNVIRARTAEGGVWQSWQIFA